VLDSTGTINFSLHAGTTTPSGWYSAEVYALNGTPVPVQDRSTVGGNNCLP
jgi:hypothetical protein